MTIPDCVRHLIYYLYPVAGTGVWQRNLRQLADRIDLFNGRRLVAVAREPSLVDFMGKMPHRVDPPDAVRAELRRLNLDMDMSVVENVPHEGECAAFSLLFGAASAYRGPADVTFYAHAKGVTWPADNRAVHLWTTLLYSVNLDYWPLVEDMLARGRTFVGTFRSSVAYGHPAVPGRVMPRPVTRCHYSGTFFWLRNRPVFTTDRPRLIPDAHWNTCGPWWSGVEVWPGFVAKPAAFGNLFSEERVLWALYDPDLVDATARRFIEWSDRNAAARRPGAVNRPWAAVGVPGP